ncbi:MAG: redoxin domain-containing protein [Verrucomicrobia subdivision 3 bacterium]|nr:redoxin domain-containing protein [Limisphaerales bacterium]
MVQLNTAYDQIKQHDAELLAIHVECSEAGTVNAVKRNKLAFPMANDDRLKIVDKYSPTSTYLIDRHGVIRARWLDSIHNRVGPDAIIKALQKLRESDTQPQKPAPPPDRNRN